MFRRRAELASPNLPPGWQDSGVWRTWPPPSSIIRGESHHREALVALCGGDSGRYLIPTEVTLILEEGNRYDPNAVRAEIGGRHVGYVAREVAQQLSPPLKRVGCWSFTVAGVIRGRFHESATVGVHLWLDRLASPGPEIRMSAQWQVEAWPPRPDEGAAR
jgi:hypothetical protein